MTTNSSSRVSSAHIAKRYAAGQPPQTLDLDGLAHPVQANSIVWLSLIHPTDDELLEILPHFIGSQSRVLDEVVVKHRRPKVVEYDAVSLVVAITYKVDHGVLRFGETQIIFGAGYLISIWRHTAMTDAESRAELEAKPDLLLRGADYVVAELLNSITDSYASQLLTLEYQVEKVEAQFFGGRFHHKDIEKAYHLRRTLLRIQSSIGPLAELSRRFSRQPALSYVGASSQAYFAEVADRIARLSELIGVLRDTTAFAFEGGMMIIQLQQNDISRKLAAWAAILAIPTALAGIYGMNFKLMPELDWSFGYPMVIGVMALVCSGLYYRFKKMQWL
ncbi:CorA family divalent cation transporter [Paenalcaligenes hominis]|uniref:CorA family divalent cation transporter n=1 Tax=Paenalcaligenes hominis TaxID=643674 RepID=UPI003525DBE2